MMYLDNETALNKEVQDFILKKVFDATGKSLVLEDITVMVNLLFMYRPELKKDEITVQDVLVVDKIIFLLCYITSW